MKSPGKVTLSNRQKKVAVDTGKIRLAARRILRKLGYEDYEISIVLVDDREITRLNRQYLHRNRPTNVISFPMASTDPPGLPYKILGDVVISAETAKRQAEEAGKSGEEEILFLLTHGLLHLVGYDHEGSQEERRKMEAQERELFSILRPPPSRKSPAR